jgi:hypothetical protein
MHYLVIIDPPMIVLVVLVVMILTCSFRDHVIPDEILTPMASWESCSVSY